MFSTAFTSKTPSRSVPLPQMTSHFALVFHEYNGACVATKHPIADGKMKMGVQVSPQEVYACCHPQTYDKPQSLFSPNLLRHTANSMMWFTKATRRPMWFRDAKPVTYNVWWPALLWKLKDNQLTVFALASHQRPTLNTRLYRAPLMNVNRSGVICLGSAHLPDQPTHERLHDIENCLFDSYFTHLNNPNKKDGDHMACNKAHRAFWKARHNTDQRVRVKDLHFLGTINTLGL